MRKNIECSELLDGHYNMLVSCDNGLYYSNITGLWHDFEDGQSQFNRWITAHQGSVFP